MLKYDLHIHSCLSPCGDDDSTPANIAGMCSLAGLRVCALTDHNTCGNVKSFVKQAQALGLIALGGMELTTSEEVHVVCLFASVDECDEFSAFVYPRIPNFANKPQRFGRQLFIDGEDEITGEEPKLLITATDIGLYDVAKIVRERGGIAFPAHINKNSFSVMSNLGMWDSGFGFNFAERTNSADLSALPDIMYVINSDAHYLEDVGKYEKELECSCATPREVIDYLRDI